MMLQNSIVIDVSPTPAASAGSTSSSIVEVKETKVGLAQREMAKDLRKLKIELDEKYHHLLLTCPTTICLFAVPIIILLCIYLSVWALTNASNKSTVVWPAAGNLIQASTISVTLSTTPLPAQKYLSSWPMEKLSLRPRYR